MRLLSSLIVSVVLSFSVLAFAQQTSPEYDRAATAYQNGNFTEAENIWKTLADQGDANSQFALGIMHLKKEASRSDDASAFRYLVEAAKKQHVASMYNLGVAYWEGRGVKRQPEKALNWWEVAAQHNDAGAQYNLGLAYYIGEGRPQSTPKAIYWTRKAAENGHTQAQALLLTMQNNPKPDGELKRSATASGLKAAQQEKTEPSKRASAIRLSNKIVPLRAGPSDQSALVSSLKPGTAVRAIRTSEEWTQIMVPRSYPVWVYDTYIIDLGKGKGKIKGNKVNIRPIASTDNLRAPPLGQLNNGDRVSIIAKHRPWVQILPSHPFPLWLKTEDLQ